MISYQLQKLVGLGLEGVVVGLGFATVLLFRFHG